MEKLSINKELASVILEALADTVSAGKNTPVDSHWYTILPVRIGSVCKMRSDLKDMESLAAISTDVKVDMFKNPIGTLIYPSSILGNFNFSAITPSDAKTISAMIHKKPVSINETLYEPRTAPIMTYSLTIVLQVKKFITDVREAAQKDEETIITMTSEPIIEFMAMILHENSKKY